MAPENFVGIDVSKAALDYYIRPEGSQGQEPNDPDGIARLIGKLAEYEPKGVVVEATGGLEMPAVRALIGARLPVSVVNPRQARDFAKATGELAKTDRIDGKVLAHFGEAIQPRLYQLPDDQAQQVAAQLARRSQLIEMLVAEKNRLGSAHREIKPNVKAHIDWLEDELEVLDQDLDQAIHTSPIWRVKDDLLQSVPGVGRVLATSLIVDLPELGTLDRKKIAALVGLAPFNRDSGKQRGKRIIWGGRRSVRTILYMGTLSAIRCNPVIRAFYERLRREGKPFKVAMTACMRKLLTILNAILRYQTPWRAPVPA
jgi:transposase